MNKDKKKSKKKTVEEMPAVAEPKRTTSSPVYPAVTSSGSHKALEAIQEDPPAPDTVQAPKTPRKGKVAASWAAKAAAVLVPAILSGFSSYQSSKKDQEDGYTTTVTAVAELQEATKELVKQVAYMQGELDAIRGEAARIHGTKAMKRLPPPPDLKTSVTLSTLPPDLGSAMKSKGRPQEQNSYSLAPMDADGIFDGPEKAVLSAAEQKRVLALEELEKKRAAEEAKKPRPAAPIEHH
jgi:ribosomal protein L35AE/L33A